MNFPELKITRRHLPHWTMEGAVYFITFRTKEKELSINEQILLLEHVKSGDDKYYDLYSAIIMPDHAHLILKPINEFTLSRIMKGIKGVSANEINKLRNSSGQVWQHESFDRIIRDEKEFNEKLIYMFNNPIKKGLIEDTISYHGWYLNERFFQL